MKREKRQAKTIASIGGQALVEGVMMRSPERIYASVRTPDEAIYGEEIKTTFLKDKYKIFKYPFFRGIGGLIDSMKIGQKALSISIKKASGIENNEPETKFEKWLDKNFGDKIMKIVMALSTVLGVGVSMFLFMFLPALLFNVTLGNFSPEMANSQTVRSMFEGLVKFLIFLGYMIFCSQIKDIKRVFQYHGAEHKTIFCYEYGDELTVENVKKCSRFHPRCGTSFVIVMLIVGIFIGMFIPFHGSILRTIIKLLLVPVMASLGYEIIKICSKYDNKITRLIATPGLWMQRISTQEPDDSMIEVAINSLKAVIPENNEGLQQI
ncbi:MAG: DUF1385 domain-containing protein [Clostridia bacterium]|nr:DUF1385 domain-containing protein [Clostridia bacterium]